MIVLCRVDHRLLHGQVALTWTHEVKADCILIANDAVVTDEVFKTTMKLAKPAGVKLVIKDMANAITAINSGVTDRYQLLIVVQTIKDAHQLSTSCPSITSVNLGGTLKRDGDEALTKIIFVNDEDKDLLRDMQTKGIDVFIQQLPAESPVQLANVLHSSRFETKER